jgi:hypothetical protein
MWRFLMLSTIGAIGMLTGQAVLGLGLYPTELAPVAVLTQGMLLLVSGTALFVSGMLGLAQGYEQVAATLTHLLATKDTPEKPLTIGDAEQLGHNGDGFWRAYQKSAAGLCLFVGGLIALVVGLDRFSFNLYVTAVGSGIGILGLAACAFLVQGLSGMRRTHREALHSSLALEKLPDISTIQEPRTRRTPRPARRHTLFERNRGQGSDLQHQQKRASRR